MDVTVADTRVKSLMLSGNMSHEEAAHLLRMCNWDVNRAQSVAAQRQRASSAFCGGSRVSNDSGVTLVRVGQPTVTNAEPTIDRRPQYKVPVAAEPEVLPKPDVSETSDADADMPGPRLQRGMSNARINLPIVTIARDILQKDAMATMDRRDFGDANNFIQTTEFTFMLPDLTCYPEDLKAFLYKDLIETSTLVSLEQSGHLNWWADIGVCQRLLPMVTSGDGNCLLHAASLGMWGLHDRQLVLRKLLCDALTNASFAEAFKRRWRYQQSISNRQCNLVLSEEEWETDWRILLKLSSPQPRSVPSNDGASRYKRSYAGQSQESEVIYESLEELHVFVLAHVLRRPIVVISKTILEDVNGEALAPIPFGGIYLPLEWDPRQCHSSPLMLTYDLSHFCALVSMEPPSHDAEDAAGTPQLTEAVPLVNPQLELLPIHFAIDPGPNFDFSKNTDIPFSHDKKMILIRNYFVAEQIQIPQLHRETDLQQDVFMPSGAPKMEPIKSESEESAGSGKDRNSWDEVDRKPLPKPMKFITKSFDTIGSKLKNMTKVNKTGKLERKASVGFVTQSTRTSSLTTDILEEQNNVLCARLHHRKTGYQDLMVANYITTMRDKFDAQQVCRQQQNAEIRRRSIEKFGLRHSGDNQLRTISGDKVGVMGFNRNQVDVCKTQRDSQMLSGYTTVGDKSFQRQDTIVVTGKSKFYTAADEDQCPAVSGPRDSKIPEEFGRKVDAESKVRKYNKLDTLHLQTDDGVELKHCVKRSDASSGDDDFVGAPTRKNAGTRRPVCDRVTADESLFRNISGNPSQDSRTSNTLAHPNRTTPNEWADGGRLAPAGRQLCRTPNCQFFGSYETDFLCSQCFKNSERRVKRCNGADCQNEGDPLHYNLCKVCFQKTQYQYQVQYPIAKTKF